MSERDQKAVVITFVLITAGAIVLVGVGLLVWFGVQTIETEQPVIRATIRQAPEEVFEDPPETPAVETDEK